MKDLFSSAAKERVTRSIAAIEKKTSAEIVVALRPRSGNYRYADLLFGATTALLVLCVFLYHPEPFDFTFFPLEQAATFVIGAVLCAHAPPIRRAWTRQRTRRENVERDAKAAFLDMGITKTRARTGVLVYLSAFERDVALLLDHGLDRATMKKEIAATEEALRAAVVAGSLDAFARALDALGDALARVHPVTADDIDELGNEVAA